VTRAVQSGQAMTELLIVAASLAIALFYPYVNGESVVTLLLRALMRVMRARSLLISVM